MSGHGGPCRVRPRREVVRIWLPGLEHRHHDDRKLPSHRDLGLAPRDLAAPCTYPLAVPFQGGILRRFSEYVVGRRHQELAHHLVAALGDGLGLVDVARLVLPRRQPEVASGVAGVPELLRVGCERGISTTGDRSDPGNGPQQRHVLLEMDVGIVLNLPVVHADILRKRLLLQSAPPNSFVGSA